MKNASNFDTLLLSHTDAYTHYKKMDLVSHPAHAKRLIYIYIYILYIYIYALQKYMVVTFSLGRSVANQMRYNLESVQNM